MRLLGVDPGYRHMGLVLVDTNGNGPKLVKRATVENGSIKEWQKGLPKLMAEMKKFIGRQKVDSAAVEMISWYGKRRGSLQLAHLAGACVGYLTALGIDTVFFSPKEVKTTSRDYPPPEGFDEHQNDALSLCRLLASK